MSKKNESEYHKNLFQQAQQKLSGMLAIGESKAQAKADGTADKKIFSWSTYNSYLRIARLFITWLTTFNLEITLLRKARPYVGEWLFSLEEAGRSAWTVHTYAKGLGKLFGISPDDPDYYDPLPRRREDIKRSRLPAERDKRFSEEINHELVSFCRGVGMRRDEFSTLLGGDCATRDELTSALAVINKLISNHSVKTIAETSKECPEVGLFRIIGRLKEDLKLCDVRSIIEDALSIPEYDRFLIIKGKGGKVRCVPIISNADAIWDRVTRAGAGVQVWIHVHDAADIHSYRSDYATALYKHFARPIAEIERDILVPWNDGKMRKYSSEIYSCRRDEAGKKLDKRAMLYASKALGHNRLDVIASHYLRNI